MKQIWEKISACLEEYSGEKLATLCFFDGVTGEEVGHFQGVEGLTNTIGLVKGEKLPADSNQYRYLVTDCETLEVSDWKPLLSHMLGAGQEICEIPMMEPTGLQNPEKKAGLWIRELDVREATEVEHFAKCVWDASGNNSPLLHSDHMAQEILDYHRLSYALSNVGMYGLFREESMLGFVGAEGKGDYAEFGIILLPSIRNMGIGTAVTKELLPILRERIGEGRMILRTDSDNTSMKVIARYFGGVLVSSEEAVRLGYCDVEEAEKMVVYSFGN